MFYILALAISISFAADDPKPPSPKFNIQEKECTPRIPVGMSISDLRFDCRKPVSEGGSLTLEQYLSYTSGKRVYTLPKESCAFTFVSDSDSNIKLSNCARFIFSNGLEYGGGALAIPQLVEVNGKLGIRRQGARLRGPVITTASGSVIYDKQAKRCRKATESFGTLEEYLAISLNQLFRKSTNPKDLLKGSLAVKNCSDIKTLTPQITRINRITSAIENPDTFKRKAHAPVKRLD